MPKRIGLIGLGHIGGAIVEAAARAPDEMVVVAALVARTGRARVAGAPPCVSQVKALLEARPDVVIECASQDALREHGPRVLQAGRDLVPASMGLLADDSALQLFEEAAAAGRSRIRLPSGAIVGVDGLLAARRLGLESVRYRFVMAPVAWGHPVDPKAPSMVDAPSQRLVYRGTARDAARSYPRHANVTATIALAGVGFEKTQVELVVDSDATDNRHEIEARGPFGSFRIAVTGRRIAEQSPSSRIVAGSLLAAAVNGSPFLT